MEQYKLDTQVGAPKAITYCILSLKRAAISLALKPLKYKTVRNRFCSHALLPAIFSCLFAGNCWAAPTVNSVIGTVTHGQSVTINGAGFGTKIPIAPVLWDTVDNIPSYSGLADGDTIPIGGTHPWPSPYGNSSGRDFVKFNTSDPQRGVSTALYKATTVNDDGAYLDGLTWPATSYAYVSWWWKQDKDVAGGNHSSKWLRMSDAANETGKTFSWTQQQAIIWTDPVYAANVWTSFGGNPVNWNFMEAWFNSANQTWGVRVNGIELYNATWSGPTFSFNELWKIGYDSGGISPPSITWWMDDIYVDSSAAKVMLGNAPTFAGSTHFEMQRPTSWANSAITVDVNQGSFGNGRTAYLYVFDSNDAVNANGFPITIGGGIVRLPAPFLRSVIVQ